MAASLRASLRICEAEIMLGEQCHGFTLYCMPRRRHVHVLVNEAGGLEVRAPWRYTLDEAKRAISEHAAWVQAQIARHRVRQRSRPMLVSGCELPLLDERLVLRLQNSAQQNLFNPPVKRGSARVYREDQNLWVELHTLRGWEQVPELLETWYRQQARDVLPLRMQPLARQLAVDYRQISIRAQRTRWGSCSPSGGISLNWRLLLLPQAVCDYVLVHELSHLQEMNHSPRFWALVASVIPDYQSRRRQLRLLSHSLAL